MKKIWISGGCILAVALIATVGLLNVNKSVYNENPDLSQKIVASKSFFPDQVQVETVDDLLKSTELIIIGEVISDGEEEAFNIYGSGEAAEELANAALKNGNNPYMPSTISKVRVLETIYGDMPENSEIEFFELGSPNILDFQTKVQKGEKLIMLLRPSDTEGMYYASNVEHSMFYLDGEDEITSMSDELICARYDGLSKEILIQDLQEGMEDKKELNSLQSTEELQ